MPRLLKTTLGVFEWILQTVLPQAVQRFTLLGLTDNCLYITSIRSKGDMTSELSNLTPPQRNTKRA